MMRNYAKLCQFCQIADVPKSCLTEEFFLFASLQASKFLIQMIDQALCNIWHVFAESGDNTRNRARRDTVTDQQNSAPVLSTDDNRG